MSTPATYRFSRFETRAAERKLLIDGQTAVVGGRAFDLLMNLIERRVRMVTRYRLLDSPRAYAEKRLREGDATAAYATQHSTRWPNEHAPSNAPWTSLAQHSDRSSSSA